MRKSLLVACCLSLITAPGLSFAQDQGGGDQGGEDQGSGQMNNDNAGDQGGETEGQEVQPPQQGDHVKMKPQEGARETAPGETHTVVKGDTLWDLSQQYLGSPWYWPKVWSYNPEIANPHWIYPGNTIRFFPAGEEGPSRVEVGNAPEEMQEDENVQGSEMMEEGGEEHSVHMQGKIGLAPRSSVRVSKNVFATRAEVEEAGKIVGAFTDSLMISTPMKAYVKLKRPSEARVGDEYAIFHTERELVHPVTGSKIGYITRIDALAKIVSVDRDIATAQLTQSFNDVRVGYMVGPAGEKLNEAITPRPNDREMKGYVVASLDDVKLLAEFHYVAIDKGTGDGVQVGNSFSIVRHGAGGKFTNPSADQDTTLPVETIGLCIVTDVKEKFSSCVLTRTIRDVVAGDMVEMRAAARTAER